MRGELDAVIKSLAFRRLAQGTQAADGYIVGPASRFPVGSFARIEARFAGHRATTVYLVQDADEAPLHGGNGGPLIH